MHHNIINIDAFICFEAVKIQWYVNRHIMSDKKSNRITHILLENLAYVSRG